MAAVSDTRIRAANGNPVRTGGSFVIYWMTAFRRPRWNHSLDRAVYWATKLAKPLLILEALRCDYPWASERIHRFIVQGMSSNAASFKPTKATYYPYVADSAAAAKGLLSALAQRACVIVTDDFPAFFIPSMIRAAAAKVTVRLEAVDSNGLIPIRSTDKVFGTAHHFRRFVHDSLAGGEIDQPTPHPLRGARIPRMEEVHGHIASRWPSADLSALSLARGLDHLPIDHEVAPSGPRGGAHAARRALNRFIAHALPRYAGLRNHPEAEATSRLSPYLHFGHISAHEVLDALLQNAAWTPDFIEPAARGQRAGWWGVDENTDAFLDELITWRELGFNTCTHTDDYEEFGSLPKWARMTLAAHRTDPREHHYSLEEFAAAETHDSLWNAAQRQLLREGAMHGYLRMLWGKKILEWSPDPEVAFDTMIELNNKYALDGRDPNSYCGISWVLGRYDRPWAPERPVFGRVRYMSSRNTARKFKITNYIEKYS